MDTQASPLTIAEEVEPTRETIAAIQQGLDSYNIGIGGPYGYLPIWLVGRDSAGTVQAGLKAGTFWTWLLVDWLWVAEPCRRRGLGSKLLLQAEEVGRKRGCAGAYLDTFSFQAPEFYRRHGYKEFGRLVNMPPKHARIWFHKTL